MSPASMAVRGAMEGTETYSSGLWSRPPTGPRPSSVGTPMAAVVLPSEPPPVAVSRTSKPVSRPSAASPARYQRVAQGAAVVHLHGQANPFQFLAHHAPHRVDGGLVIGAAIHARERGQVVQKDIEPGLYVRKRASVRHRCCPTSSRNV